MVGVLVGEFVRRNQIAAADLGAVHADLARRMLDHALGEVGGLGAPGPTIRPRLRVLVNMPCT